MARELEAHEASRLVAEVGEAERAERLRLADVLHDGPLQRLLAARQDAEEALAGDRDALSALPLTLGELAVELRALTKAIHEDVLDQLPLEAQIRRIAEDAAIRGRFEVEIEVQEEADGLHDAIVRDAARELLANVARHAQATHAEVVVSVCDEGGVRLLVRDDGIGFDPVRAARRERSGHVGLGRLRRLADELGGTLEVEGVPDEGTVAVINLPGAALEAQRSMEEQLREERRWSAALVAAVQDGLLVFREGTVVQVNDAFCAMTGFTREELLGTHEPDHPFWPVEDREALMQTVRTAHDAGGLDQVVELQRVDGSRFPALASSAPVHDGVGSHVGMLVTIKDLTQREREEERRRLQTELSTTIGATRRLTSMLAAVTDGREAVLDALGTILVEHLTWADVAVNIRDEDGTWRVVWTSGAALDEALGDATYTDAQWTPFLDERFFRRGTYFVPEEANVRPAGAWHVPEIEPSDDPDAWRPRDELFVPMHAADGRLTGLLSVDQPLSGRRPTDNELDVLSAVAEHAALALALLQRPAS